MQEEEGWEEEEWEEEEGEEEEVATAARAWNRPGPGSRV